MQPSLPGGMESLSAAAALVGVRLLSIELAEATCGVSVVTVRYALREAGRATTRRRQKRGGSENGAMPRRGSGMAAPVSTVEAAVAQPSRVEDHAEALTTHFWGFSDVTLRGRDSR